MKSATLDPEVEVLCGANSARAHLAPGTVVARLRIELGSQLNVPAGSPIRVDGVPAGDSTIVVPGTRTVEFLKPSGEKG